MDEQPRRGPWDVEPAAEMPVRPMTATGPREAPRQSLLWAAVSTAALGGFLWFLLGHWVFGLAGVVGIWVHEYGHVLAMNRFGMGPARIHIVPFLGGLAWPQRPESSEWDGVRVALAGPAFGLLAMIPFVAAGYALGAAEYFLAAAMIALINLVNLAPAPPLDGSRALGPILARIHPMVEKAALVLIGAAVIWWGVTTGRLILTAFLAISLIGYLKQRGLRHFSRRLTGGETALSVGLFIGTTALCAAALVGAMLPLTGSVEGSIDYGASLLGIPR